MRIIKLDDNPSLPDPVRTEEVVWSGLLGKKGEIDDEKVFVLIPLACSLNSSGVETTQELIDRTADDVNEKYVFVCQHILVNRLKFPPLSQVFACHATSTDNFLAIPHQALNCAVNPGGLEERSALCSFQGTLSTHPVRKVLSTSLGNVPGFRIHNTRGWHFGKSLADQSRNRDEYITLLGDSKICLCPRGTGPSTLRIWEALASGCVPLIISDELKLPLPDLVEWEKAALLVPEKEAHRVPEHIPPEDTLLEMGKYGQKIYREYFSDDNLHMTVLLQV